MAPEHHQLTRCHLHWRPCHSIGQLAEAISGSFTFKRKSCLFTDLEKTTKGFASSKSNWEVLQGGIGIVFSVNPLKRAKTMSSNMRVHCMGCQLKQHWHIIGAFFLKELFNHSFRIAYGLLLRTHDPVSFCRCNCQPNTSAGQVFSEFPTGVVSGRVGNDPCWGRMIHHPLGERLDHILCFGLPMVALVKDVDHSEATCSVSPKNALVLHVKVLELENVRAQHLKQSGSILSACWRLQGWFGSFLAFRTSQRPSQFNCPLR